MRQGAITVHDVGKRYRPQGGARSTTLKGYLLSGRSVVQSKSFWGLRHISFAVAPGQAVGVVGLNGAGKSTLLRLIGGVGRPDEGQIKVMGRIGALLDIGAGLTDDLTGRENIFLLGVIAGMRRTEVAERFDEIVAFAELEAAVENPVRSYSTGMRMRLAFAVAVHVRPDILLIDEALAVGDQAFQQKCIARVKEILNDGATIFFVSHDVSQVREICDHVLFLRGGRVVGYGPIDEMLPLYTSAVEAKVASVQHEPFAVTKLPVELVPQVSRFGNGELQITAVVLLNEQSTPTSTIVAGDRLSISLTYVGATRDRNAVIVIGIYAADDTCCF
jgi:lipopolysaccharide transport system ATP-binding protein